MIHNLALDTEQVKLLLIIFKSYCTLCNEANREKLLPPKEYLMLRSMTSILADKLTKDLGKGLYDLAGDLAEAEATYNVQGTEMRLVRACYLALAGMGALNDTGLLKDNAGIGPMIASYKKLLYGPATEEEMNEIEKDPLLTAFRKLVKSAANVKLAEGSPGPNASNTIKINLTDLFTNPGQLKDLLTGLIPGLKYMNPQSDDDDFDALMGAVDKEISDSVSKPEKDVEKEYTDDGLSPDLRKFLDGDTSEIDGL